MQQSKFVNKRQTPRLDKLTQVLNNGLNFNDNDEETQSFLEEFPLAYSHGEEPKSRLKMASVKLNAMNLFAFRVSRVIPVRYNVFLG